jgi:putative endonuclease
MFHVYVLRSRKNGRLYTGHTNDLPRRLAEHNSGQNPSTRFNGPFEIVHAETFPTRSEAYARELFLKSGRGREQLKGLLMPE